MGRHARATYSEKYGCWVSTAVGELRVTKNGRPYRTLVRAEHLTHPKRDAVAAQAWLHGELEKMGARAVMGDDITFEQLSEFYLEDAQPRLGAETYLRAVEHLDRFGKWPSPDDPVRMDRQPCRRITPEDVEGFAGALLRAGRSESYITDGLLKTLKACYRWAYRVKPGRFAGLPLEANPVQDVKAPAVKRRAVRVESPENVQRLIVWGMRRAKRQRLLNRRFARISMVLLLCLRDSGARPKELCSATWDDWRLKADG